VTSIRWVALAEVLGSGRAGGGGFALSYRLSVCYIRLSRGACAFAGKADWLARQRCKRATYRPLCPGAGRAKKKYAFSPLGISDPIDCNPFNGWCC